MAPRDAHSKATPFIADSPLSPVACQSLSNNWLWRVSTSIETATEPLACWLLGRHNAWDFSSSPSKIAKNSPTHLHERLRPEASLVTTALCTFCYRLEATFLSWEVLWSTHLIKDQFICMHQQAQPKKFSKRQAREGSVVTTAMQYAHGHLTRQEPKASFEIQNLQAMDT